MMKKVFLSLALLTGMGMATSLKAQESQLRPITFRIHAGATASKVANGLATGKIIPGYRAGFSADFIVQDVVSIRPTLLAISKGDMVNATVGSITARSMYVQLPVYLNVYMPYSKNTVWYANLGPYVAYGFYGKAQYSKDAQRLIPEGTNTNLFNNKFPATPGKEGEARELSPMNSLDAGISANLGVEFGHFILEIGGDLGMMRVANTLTAPEFPGWETDGKSLNLNGHLSIGWRF